MYSFLSFHPHCEQKRTEVREKITNLLNGQNPLSYQYLHIYQLKLILPQFYTFV